MSPYVNVNKIACTLKSVAQSHYVFNRLVISRMCRRLLVDVIVPVPTCLALFFGVALVTQGQRFVMFTQAKRDCVRGRFSAVAPTMLAKFPTFSRTLRTPTMSPPVVIAGTTTTKTELLDPWLAANLARLGITIPGAALAGALPVVRTAPAHRAWILRVRWARLAVLADGEWVVLATNGYVRSPVLAGAPQERIAAPTHPLR
jgi:hypothetical protein